MANKIITIGIIGSRERDSQEDYLKMVNKFEQLYNKLLEKNLNTIIRVCSGGCKLGGDRFAEEIAKGLGLSIMIHYPAKHTLTDGLTKQEQRRQYAEICFARNTLIAQDSDFLIAMVSKNSNGTKDTIRKYEVLKNKKAIII